MKQLTKPALTRQAWLDALGRRLVWSFPAAQVREILSDYQEQFDAGQEHGRTDAEIIQSLGTPAEAAMGLLEEEPSAKMAGLRQTGLWAAALALCCGFLWINLSVYAFQVGAVLFLPLASAVLFLLLRGGARVELERRFPNGRTVSPVLGYYVPFGLVLVFEAAEQILQLLSQIGRLPEQVGPYFVGEVNMIFILALEAVLVALLAVSLWRSTAVSIRYFPGVIHIFGAGSAAFFVYLYYMTPFQEAPWSPQEALVRALLPYGVGLAVALVFQRWVDGRKPLPRLFRDGAVTWEDWRHRLGVALLGWYDAPQAMEVLEDYQEQYDLGREQGRSEEELLSALGRPEEVVRDLLKEDRKARLHRRKIWIWTVLAGISGWLLLGYVSAFELGAVGWNGALYYGFDAWKTGAVALLLGTVSLFVLLHVPERAAVERRFPARQKLSVWFLVLPLVCSALVEVLGLKCIYKAPARWDPIFLGQSLVWYFITFLEFSIFLLAVLLIWTLARCVSGSIQHFPAVPLLAGSFAQVGCAGLYLSSMDLESGYLQSIGAVRAFLANLWPLGLGVLLAAAGWLVLRFAGRPRKEG